MLSVQAEVGELNGQLKVTTKLFGSAVTTGMCSIHKKTKSELYAQWLQQHYSDQLLLYEVGVTRRVSQKIKNNWYWRQYLRLAYALRKVAVVLWLRWERVARYTIYIGWPERDPPPHLIRPELDTRAARPRQTSASRCQPGLISVACVQDSAHTV